MSNVSLGLSDKQIAYLTFFTKADPPRVIKPREQVYQKQREHLTKCQSLLSTLQQAFQTLQKETLSFSLDFRKISKDNLKNKISEIDRWADDYKKFEKEINESRAVFVPHDLLDHQSKLSTTLKQLQGYVAQVREFVELCDIEEQITTRYRQDKRDYNAIERLYDRYLKLSQTTQGWILPDCSDKLNELKGEVESLHRFNRSMETLTKDYLAFDQSYKSKNARFRYADQQKIKKDMGSFAAWLSNYKKLQAWVMALPETKREALIGDHNTTSTNKNHEYRMYGDFAGYLKTILDDSEQFYAACKFCTEIEQMSKMVNTKKPEVEKLISRYESLDQSIKRFIEESFVTLLYSLRESSDACTRLQESLSKLEASYHLLPNNVKNLSYTYSYDSFAIVQSNAEKAQTWLDEYEVVHKWAAAQSGKVAYFRTQALAQKAKNQANNAERLKTYVKWFENVKRAHSFEAELIQLKTILKNNAKQCSDKKAEYKRLPSEVQKLISTQWIDFLNRSEQFHNLKSSLEVKVKRQVATIDNLWEVLPQLDYTTFETASKHKEQLIRWQHDFASLSNELQDFEYTYKEDPPMVDRLFSEKAKVIQYLSDYALLSQNYEIYQWSEMFVSDLNAGNVSSSRYTLESLTQQLNAYQAREDELSKFDGQGKLAQNFEVVNARIQQIHQAVENERLAGVRKARNIRIAWIFSELLMLGLYIVALLMTEGTIPFKAAFYTLPVVQVAVPLGLAVANMFLHRRAFKSCVPIILFDVLSVILAIILQDAAVTVCCVLSLVVSYAVIYIYAKETTKAKMKRATPILISIVLVSCTILVLLAEASFPHFLLWLLASVLLIIVTFIVMMNTAETSVGQALSFLIPILCILYVLYQCLLAVVGFVTNLVS